VVRKEIHLLWFFLSGTIDGISIAWIPFIVNSFSIIISDANHTKNIPLAFLMRQKFDNYIERVL